LGIDVTPADLHALTTVGSATLFLRDGTGALQLVNLDGDRAVLGRAPGSDLQIAWDPRVSGVHAFLERRGPQWILEDDGMSRNGTFVDGERVRGQRTLRDGDVIQLGDTLIGYRDPTPTVAATLTVPTVSAPAVSTAQRRVLVALCRPLLCGETTAPATNEQIAHELVLSLPAVKGHLRVLFNRFGLEKERQNQKRLLLAERALASGVVSARDLR
jgi:hypothetical protein